MNGLDSMGFDLFLLLAGAALLAGVLLLLRAATNLAPLSRARRESARRAFPVFAALAVLLYLLFAVRTLFAGQPGLAALAVMLIVAAVTIAAWGPLRDVVSGVFIKAGRVCEAGDHVRLNDVHGRISLMGLRSVLVETSKGEEAVIPYSQLLRERLIRTAVLEGVSPHVFRLSLPPSAPLTEVRETIQRSALLCHWSAAGRDPEIAFEGDAAEITVYALDPARGVDIEASVRRAVARDAQPG